MRGTLALGVIAILTTATRAQIFNPYSGIGQPYHGQNNLINDANTLDPRGAPHPAVVENALAESQLPPELLNPFYKNPTIVAGLAKASWFGHKEFPVHNREADKIPRSEILKIVRRIEHQRK